MIHAGQGGPDEPRQALERAAASLQSIAGEGDAWLVIELTAGGAGSVAATFEQARGLFDAVEEERLRLCIDTCHLFAAGYALHESEGVDACFAELREHGLADRLVLVHANDAKFDRGSHRDRHEHIGEGGIGFEGFRAILHQPETQSVAVIVETPGGLEAHARNIATLRTLADEGGGDVT